MNQDLNFDELLGPKPVADDPARRAAAFARSAGRLRWAARVRRSRAVAAVGLVFAAGVGVGWLTKPVPPAPPAEREVVPVPLPVPVPYPVEPETTGPVAELTPAQIELEAEKADDRATAAALYRRAGDAYLARTEIPSAARCYRIHLSEAGPAGAAVAADDSWLLMRMKFATRKETDREPNPGT